MPSLLQREALENALKQLWVLDALEIDGGITPLGRQMVSLPLEPSLARALIAATQLGCLSQATTVAAMLSAESIFQGNRSGHAQKEKTKNRKGYAFQRQFNEKPSSILVCPGQQVKSCMYHSQRPVNAFVTAAMLSAESIFQGNRSVHAEKEKKRKRKEKTTPFGVNLMRNHVLYRAAQGGQVMHVSQSMPCQCIHHCCHAICYVHLPESTNRSGRAHPLWFCYP